MTRELVHCRQICICDTSWLQPINQSICQQNLTLDSCIRNIKVMRATDLRSLEIGTYPKNFRHFLPFPRTLGGILGKGRGHVAQNAVHISISGMEGAFQLSSHGPPFADSCHFVAALSQFFHISHFLFKILFHFKFDWYCGSWFAPSSVWLSIWFSFAISLLL